MKFNPPWFIRLPLIILGLTLPLSYTFSNPYWVFGGKKKEAEKRFVHYHQVHYKNEADVKVHTEESKQFYDELRAGNYPVPHHSHHLSDEEIEEKGLYVIRSSNQKL